MLLLISSNSVTKQQMKHQKCIHFIGLILVLTICNYTAAQEKFQLCRRLSQAICKSSSLFALENKIQPPLKYLSNFPPSNNPSCKTVQVISDWDAEAQVCKKSIMCTGSTTRTADNNMDPDPNQTYYQPCDPPLPEGKIVGGVEACLHEFPYQVRLIQISGLATFCGGSIVNEKYVLTAAHCIRDSEDSEVQVVVGDHDRTVNEGTEQVVNVEVSFSHLGYAVEHGQDDIALLKVTPPLQLNQNVQPILLPRSNYDPREGNAVASGWGDLRYGADSIPRILQKVTVPILAFEECKKAYDVPTEEIKYDITESMICTEDLINGGKAPCNGDSGGPLAQILPNESYVQIGIVSWALGCAAPGYPNVYTKVSKYVDWIREHMMLDPEE